MKAKTSIGKMTIEAEGAPEELAEFLSMLNGFVDEVINDVHDDIQKDIGEKNTMPVREVHKNTGEKPPTSKQPPEKNPNGPHTTRKQQGGHNKTNMMKDCPFHHGTPEYQRYYFWMKKTGQPPPPQKPGIGRPRKNRITLLRPSTKTEKKTSNKVIKNTPPTHPSEAKATREEKSSQAGSSAAPGERKSEMTLVNLQGAYDKYFKKSSEKPLCNECLLSIPRKRLKDAVLQGSLWYHVKCLNRKTKEDEKEQRNDEVESEQELENDISGDTEDTLEDDEDGS